MTHEDLDVIYLDNHVIGVIKPFNVPVQQDSSGDPDLLNAVKAYIKEKYQKPGRAFAALVHRLDRPAGGVIVFARTSKAASRLAKSFKERDVEKEYLCVVEGTVEGDAGQLKHWLKKDRGRNLTTPHRRPVAGSRKALLRYEVIETRGDKTLMQVRPETGRSHQIRCQLSAMGHSLCGDRKYGSDNKNVQLALWAHSLVLPHPVKPERVRLSAACPDEPPWNVFTVNTEV